MTDSQRSVLIGLSGGVDSATAAALLKRDGYECSVVTFVMTEDMRQNFNDVKAVADSLGIPLYQSDLADEFKAAIISYFINSYKKGETPNPCVLCNRIFKFKNLIEKADELGVKYVATGHYANVRYNDKTGRYELKRSLNEKKDQSYFLYRLAQDQLSRIIFPIGDMIKDDVRAMAGDFGLCVSKRKDSQDICFIKGMEYTDFIEKNINSGHKFKGAVFLDMNGREIGKGENHMYYTPGQRRGLTKGFNERLYVIRKDPKNNTVTLGSEADLYVKNITVSDTNLISVPKLESEMKVKVRIRNSQNSYDAIIRPLNENIAVTFLEPARAPVRGQSAVFYEGDTVVGGGLIHDGI